MTKFGKYNYEVTREGILNIQVCSNCPVDAMDELEKAVQTNNPAGTSYNWQIENEGDLKPVKCDDDPNRKHYVFSC